ncbi:TonB-dependent hemoglobin/transferrin/lactoferrin family receptor [Wohlfahrtiimonas chitiniclastica]|uniref:TonB-dependent hemoglobin/transferrin/lactoferrin family receptor n=1 Tax=Wohlfahrtiimonas chitiniclastica TaxID=400946 RepID=UPI001BD0D0F4|nr:TonB-dependent hemoglobin/transferrin/lactoferrin family receptor [Wohlfahrtiimonas chitiniclastica]MBS7829287.1 TonB-dependent hemoglobin/transferrin/lactoferrin family receptor [Wohlfahrtiimonas chitiniclastica]
MHPKYPVTTALAMSSLLLPHFTFAQPSSDEEDTNAINLDKVVVIGEVKPQAVFKSTQTAADITKNMVQDERDLFRNELSVGVTESGRAGSNGYAIRGVDKDRVAVIVDGLPQAETFMPSIYKGYGYFNGSMNNTEFENISSVTVNKGANSVSDGSGAVGGSVYFKTKTVDDFVKPGEKLGLYTKGAYSSKNKEWRYVLGAGFKVNGFFGFAQLTQRRGHETKNNGRGDDVYGWTRGRPDPSKFRTTSWLTKLGYELNESNRITAFYEDRAHRQFTEEKTFDGWNTHRFASDTAPYRRYGLEYDYFATDSTWLDTINIIAADQKIKMQAHTYNVNQRDFKVDQRYFREFEQRQKLLKAQLFTQAINLGGIEHTFQGKLEFRKGHLKNQNYDVLYFTDSVHPSKYSIMTPVSSKVLALSLQDEIQVTPELHLSLGARYDQYTYSPKLDGSNKFPISFDDSKKHFSRPSWSIGATYNFTPEHQIGYKISTGFRAPKIEELFFEFGKGGANHFMPNPQLKPETALNQEITYQFQNDYSQFGIGIFESRYRNFIDERVSEGRAPNPYYDPYNPWGGGEYFFVNQIQFVNIARAKIKGIEINGSINGELLGLSDSWTFNAKAQYSRGKNQDGDPLKSIQPWSALVGIEYQAPSDRWNLALTGRYSAAKKGKDTKETQYSWRGVEEKEWPWLSPSYFVVDLTGQVNIDKDMTINFGVFNLFNRSYTTWDSLRDIPTYGTTNRVDPKGKGLNRFTAPKRNFMISFEARF